VYSVITDFHPNYHTAWRQQVWNISSVLQRSQHFSYCCSRWVKCICHKQCKQSSTTWSSECS